METERRRSARERLVPPEICIVYTHAEGESQDAAPSSGADTILARVLNRSDNGLLLESPVALAKGSLLDVQTRFNEEKTWLGRRGRVVWSAAVPHKANWHLVGLDLDSSMASGKRPSPSVGGRTKRMRPSELEFLLQTRLFGAIPEEAQCPVLNLMTPREVAPGERFIRQGDEGDNFYVIQDGSCIVSVEKDGSLHPISRLKAGDVVGEMALFTGEPRSAHVDAETNLTLWSLTRAQFDALCGDYPDLKDFLTELVTHRFSTERLTAQRGVGKYLINEIVGRGGWSVVYRGTHTALGLPVAVKMLKHTMALDPDFSERFRNEAKIIASLNHENIVRVYDIEELYRTIFIIMEYLDGVPLAYILEKMPRLPLPQVLEILFQVCAGLAYAHEKGVIHQDVAPANIFIQPGGRVKIVDFGLACPPGTIDVCLPGTVFYMAPEQIDGELVDERSDIYSLGITAYEMITGRRPYPEDDLGRLMELHVTQDVPDPSEIVPDLPHEMSYFVKRATQRDPGARFRTMWEILRDLQPLGDRLGVTRQPAPREYRKMMSLFLFYKENQELSLHSQIENFTNELIKIGVMVRTVDFKDV
jgi:serine/threonine protein kinase